MNQKQATTMTRLRPILTDLGARCLWQAKGPNGSIVDAQTIGGAVVIFHFYAEGGVQHYVQGHGATFEAMATQLHQIAAATV